MAMRVSSRARAAIVAAVVVVGGLAVALLGATTPSFGRQLGPDPGACYHFDGSIWMCPGQRPDSQYRFVVTPGRQIESGTLTLNFGHGQTKTLTLTANIDAIFLSREAAEILLEYYKNTKPMRGDSLRRHIDRRPASPPQRRP